ncbi:MAG: TonB-dependent receptor plug domain-containing protein, partial [Aquirufa sp.]
MKTKITSLLTLVLVLMMQVSFAQKATKTVTGTVADENGQPLVGASVVVNGTKTGTNTDKSGKFSIAAAEGQSLTFSFVGYNKSTVAVTSATSSVQVALTSDNTLDEVIVTSYSTSTKQSFTGTAKVVDAKNIERKNFSNISKGLAGEAAGVTVINSSGQPGTSAAIRIRGIGTVNGSRGPLYVLDGVPFEGNINSINPGDIENTTILKDAAATAIYGSRGANGVVVINTKKGSKTGDAVIELELKSGQNMSLLPRYSTIRNPEQYIGLTWEGYYNKGVALANANPTA